MDSESIKMHIFLDTCYEAENSCAEMYHLFAHQFTANRKISRLWSKTALEEENHACHVYLAKKMVNSIHWVCLESWRNASSALAMIKQSLMTVRESPPSIKSALLMALECEHHMENLHMQSAILVQEQFGNSMFRALMKDDRGHIEMLQTALDEVQRENDGTYEIIDFEGMTTPEIIDCIQTGKDLERAVNETGSNHGPGSSYLHFPVRQDPALPAPWQSDFPEKTASG